MVVNLHLFFVMLTYFLEYFISFFFNISLAKLDFQELADSTFGKFVCLQNENNLFKSNRRNASTFQMSPQSGHAWRHIYILKYCVILVYQNNSNFCNIKTWEKSEGGFLRVFSFIRKKTWVDGSVYVKYVYIIHN